jgi:Cu2+-exporting ATPase
MNTVALPHAPATAKAADCFHCSLPVPSGALFSVTFDGRLRPLCCAGCEAVAGTIISGGLADYYRTRTAPPDSPALTIPESLRALERYDLPGVRERFVERGEDHQSNAVLMLEGITCAACAWLVEQRLRAMPGVDHATVNYATHRLQVDWRDNAADLPAILRTIQGVGIQAYPSERHADRVRQATARRRALWEIFVAAFAMMQVMMYTVPMYLADPGDVTPDIRQLMQWASLVLTVPVLAFSARPIFRGAWSALAAGTVAMDVPIALAILLTFVASVWAMTMGAETYFDSIAMFVLLLLSARFIEAEMRRRRVADLERITRPVPAVAERIANFPADLTGHDVAAVSLVAGDVVRVASGSVLPADGEIIAGSADVDEAVVSGESHPVSKGPGDSVFGGSINGGSPLMVRVTRVGESSTLAAIVRASEIALGARPAIAGRAEAMASHLAYVTLALAGLTALAWIAVDVSRAFDITIAVLAITCPCALALAVPAASSAATAGMARAGLIVRRGRALDVLPSITDLIVDKTGTLTTGDMKIVAIDATGIDPDQAMSIAAGLEQGSRHPLAQALLREASARNLRPAAAAELQAVPRGIRGVIDGTAWSIGAGNDPCAETWTPDLATTTIVLARQGETVARIALQDEIRRDARDFLSAMRDRGIQVHLLSGDQEASVRLCADTLGIATWRARLTPDEKRAYALALQRRGKVILALGDGINDAPVLSQANLGVAMGSGADLARAQADMILTSVHLLPIARALGLARRARAIILENLGWAFAYNAIAVPAAAFGLVTPWMAAVGMSTSSLLVIANASRVTRGPA